MSEKVRKILDLKVREASFKLRMADQTIAKPLGMVDQVPIRVGESSSKLHSWFWMWGRHMKCCWEGHG